MAGFGIPGVISDRIFGPPPPDYKLPEVGPELRAACDWFKSFMREGEWQQRRIQIATRFYKSARSEVADKGRFFLESDTFGWYLFLCEALLEHPWNYDPTFGSRVIPIFAAIGRNLNALLMVQGLELRVRRLIQNDRSQPNGGLFELLVAAAYSRAGGQVSFREERPGGPRSHDLDVFLRGKAWAVECKRMETSAYGEAERNLMRDIWAPSSAYLTHIRRSVIASVDFIVELKEVSPSYLTSKTKNFLELRQCSLLWSDEVSRGYMGDLDLGPLQELLKTDDVLVSGSKMQALLLGRYIRGANMIWALNANSKTGPRYISDCDFAVALNWQCLAEASIAAKARSITTHLSRAVTQLPAGAASVVHIGFEAVDGDVVEVARHARIIQTVQTFDPGIANIEYVYCHYFAPESPPEELFAFDETSQWLPLKPSGPPPLRMGSLVSPDSVPWRPGWHWEPPKGE